MGQFYSETGRYSNDSSRSIPVRGAANSVGAARHYVFLWHTFNVLMLILSIFLLGSYTAAHAEPPAKLIKFWDDYEEQSSMKIKHDVWQEILNEYLTEQAANGVNRFDYGRVSGVDHQRLKDYLAYLQRMEPRQLNKSEAMAYWINLYNAALVELVIDAEKSGNVKSVREIRSGTFSPGPWKRKIFNVVQQEMTLNDIQHGVLRPIWKDHRVHFAITTASVGAPNLLKTAFTGDNLESLLASAEQAYLNAPRGVQVDGNELVLSSVFDWYAEDFASNKAAFMAYLSQHVSDELRSGLNAANGTRFEYDWSLNDAR